MNEATAARDHRAVPTAEATIFVNIASYRDRELPRTIDSAISRAAHPERLRFGICWQLDEAAEHDLDRHLDDDRFSIERVHYTESHGCTWARSRAQRAFDDEDYYLQIDAHMRFADGWDDALIAMLRGLPAEKPVLTVYPHAYTTDGAGNDQLSSIGDLHVLELDYITERLQVRLRTRCAEATDRPGPSPFIAAGFVFAPGTLCREVPYDPFGYFTGEEISLSMRAYTWGYDFFHPSQQLIWHRYDHGEPLHWTDHPEVTGVYEHRARERLTTLLIGDADELGRFGLGPHRTRRQFEESCGIDFTAVAAGEAYGTPERLVIELDLDTEGIPERDDYELWVFALFDADGQELFRRDIYDPAVMNGQSTRWRVTAELTRRPTQYLVWPKTRNGEWGERRMRDLPESAVTRAG